MPISRELQYSKCDKTKLLYRTSSVLEGTRRLRQRSAAILAILSLTSHLCVFEKRTYCQGELPGSLGAL